MTFEEMLKIRPADPNYIKEQVEQMHEETRSYEEMASEFNQDSQFRRTSRRKRISSLHTEN